jgi:hypothetical protein
VSDWRGLWGGSAPGPEDGETIEELLRFQAAACGHVGSPLYEDLLNRAADDYEQGGTTRRALQGHEADPRKSALALRLMAAVHRLVLTGEAPELAERYRDPGRNGELTWEAFRDVLEDHEEALHKLIELPVQTNEVGRCAALLPGFLGVAASTGLPLRLLEVGASAGLNLGWDAYRFEAGEFSWGPADSPLRIDFELSGGEMPSAEASVAERAGCDPEPVDPTSEEGRLTLLACCWPDQAVRVERLRAALEIAAARPAPVERSGALEWATSRLAEPAPGRATVLYHSIVMQYLTEDEQASFPTVVSAAGERANAEAPLAWLRMEPAGERAEVRITTWPGGEDRLLARSGYHGAPVELSGDAG